MDFGKSWAESKGLNDDIVKYEVKEQDESSLSILSRNTQKRLSQNGLPIQRNHTATPACQTVVHHFHGQVTLNYVAGVGVY